jgi:hypothetical protein
MMNVCFGGTGMMKNVCKFCASVLFLFSMMVFVAPASADNALLSDTSFGGVGSEVAITVIHTEPDNQVPEDHKGWATITVTNTGTQAWGDMHFSIAGAGVSSVDWIDGGLFDPTYKLNNVPTAMTWVIDNVAANATLDMYFYANPVNPGQSATFSAYTDNTKEMLPFFGLCVYPTPVPEPATLAMLSFGGLMFFRKRRA